MRVGVGQIHRGVGQAGCFAGGFADNMEQWIAGLSAELPSDAAVGCGSNGGTPCASPTDAANMALIIARSWCQESNNQAQFGCPSDPNCNDMGVEAAAPYVARALAIFSGFPQSVWATEAANAASGNYYGTAPAGPCPPGTFYNTVAGGGFQCNAPNAAPQQFVGDQGPQVNILTGQPIPTTITPSNSPTTAAPAQPAGTSKPDAGTGSGGTSNTSTASDPFAWLTETSIGTVPNWMLLFGGLGALILLPSLLKGGR